MFDLVIIDTPPVLPVADALSLGRWVDGAIMVIRYDVSRFPLVDRARKRLISAGIPILKTVVNGVKTSRFGSGYGYGYGYGYGDGYGYGERTAAAGPPRPSSDDDGDGPWPSARKSRRPSDESLDRSFLRRSPSRRLDPRVRDAISTFADVSRVDPGQVGDRCRGCRAWRRSPRLLEESGGLAARAKGRLVQPTRTKSAPRRTGQPSAIGARDLEDRKSTSQRMIRDRDALPDSRRFPSPCAAATRGDRPPCPSEAERASPGRGDGASGLRRSWRWPSWPSCSAGRMPRTFATWSTIWNRDPNYSHGFLVVPVALVILWRRWVEAEPLALEPSPWGWVGLVGGAGRACASATSAAPNGRRRPRSCR